MLYTLHGKKVPSPPVSVKQLETKVSWNFGVNRAEMAFAAMALNTVFGGSDEKSRENTGL